MFCLTRKTFAGSYFRLTRTSRSYCSANAAPTNDFMSSSTPGKLKFGLPRERWCMSSNTARAHATFASVRSGSFQFARISRRNGLLRNPTAGARALHDDCGKPIDEPVPDAARLVVVAAALDEHAAG